MNEEEIRTAVEEIKAQLKAKEEYKDKSDDELDEVMLDGFFKAYTEGKMSKDDLGAIIGVMGYEFTEDFDKDEEAPQNMPSSGGEEAAGEEAAGGPEDLSKEELEETRTIAPGESKMEFKDKIDDLKKGESIDAGKEEGEEKSEEFEEESEEEEEEEPEEEQRKKASELWKMNLNK